MIMLRQIVKTLSNYFYPNYKDDNAIFYEWIGKLINSDSVILDLGAGAGKKWPYDFSKHCSKVVGIDKDPRVVDNPNLSEAVCLDFYKNNFKDNTFDIIFANNVVEHIAYPERFLAEVKRILKPSGYFFFKTPNRWHYVPLVGTNTPYWFHVFYCQLKGRSADDTFPTYYRVNSYRTIENLSRILNYDFELKMFEARPEYLSLEPISFLMGVGYERLVNRFEFLNKFRVVMMVKLRFKVEKIAQVRPDYDEKKYIDPPRYSGISRG